MEADEIINQRSMNWISREFKPEQSRELNTIHAIWIHREDTYDNTLTWWDFFIVRDDQVIRITAHLCRILQYEYCDERSAMIVGGGGMDMAFHVASSLSYNMFEDSYVIRSNRVR